MSQKSHDDLVNEQIAYYRARAPEYDEWYRREGRYDHGPEENRIWSDEVETVVTALEDATPNGHILELACGTGWWTARLAAYAESLTAVDASPEVIAINRDHVKSERVRYVEADLFAWQPDRRYDFVFFSFWMSHVPPDRFASFWQTVQSCLAPGGRVFFIDSLFNATSTALNHRLESPDEVSTNRRLNDGSEYEIVKIFYRKEDLESRLNDLGWDITVRETPNHFLFGSGNYNT